MAPRSGEQRQLRETGSLDERLKSLNFFFFFFSLSLSAAHEEAPRKANKTGRILSGHFCLQSCHFPTVFARDDGFCGPNNGFFFFFLVKVLPFIAPQTPSANRWQRGFCSDGCVLSAVVAFPVRKPPGRRRGQRISSLHVKTPHQFGKLEGEQWALRCKVHG